jgi:hypothetical protein
MIANRYINRLACAIMAIALAQAMLGCGGRSAQSSSDAQGEQQTQETQVESREQRDGFANATTETLGRFSFQLPDYLAKDEEAQADESEGKRSYQCDDDAIGLTLALVNNVATDKLESGFSALVDSFVESAGGDEREFVVQPAFFEVNGLIGYRAQVSFEMGSQRLPVVLRAVILVDEDDRKGITVFFLQAMEAAFDYEEDFDRLVASVRYDASQGASNADGGDGAGVSTGPDGVDESTIREDFRAAMDSYEAFFDEYVDFMQRYRDNPTDLELLTQLSDMLARESEMLEEFEAWEDNGLTDAELAYYLEVHSRIYAKLLQAM